MIYTIGSKRSYDQAIRDGAAVKLGKQPDGYPGGIVFRTQAEAQEFIDTSAMDRLLPRPGVTWNVYGLMTDWETGTYVTESGERALLHDTPFVAVNTSEGS